MSAATVGFVGLGEMGTGMALNLHQFLSTEQKKLHIWNRTATAPGVVEATQAGAIPHESLGELVNVANVIFLMLSNDEAVQATVETIASAVGTAVSTSRTLLVINCSTILPATSVSVEQKLQAVGITYVVATVFGRPNAARAKQLLVAYGGLMHVYQQIEPYLQAIGRHVIIAGETPEKANTLKLVGNFLVCSVIEQLAEAMTLADKNGVERKTFLSLVDAFFPAPPYKVYSNLLAGDSFSSAGGFPVNLGLKDVGHIRHLAQESGTPLPVADIVFEHLLAAKEAGYGNEDWSSLVKIVRQNAGIPPK